MSFERSLRLPGNLPGKNRRGETAEGMRMEEVSRLAAPGFMLDPNPSCRVDCQQEDESNREPLQQ